MLARCRGLDRVGELVVVVVLAVGCPIAERIVVCASCVIA